MSACSDKARKRVTSSLFHEFRVRDSGLQRVLRPVKHDRSGSLPSVPNQLASNWTARLDNSVIAVGGKLDEVTAIPGLLEFLGSEKTEILNAFNGLSAGCGRVETQATMPCSACVVLPSSRRRAGKLKSDCPAGERNSVAKPVRLN